MNNKALILIFNQIYNGGKLTKLITTKKNIKRLDRFYKDNFQLYDDYDTFYSNLDSSLKKVLVLSHAANSEFEKQFKKRQALQPAILNECYVIQTIANLLNLNHFIDADEKQENV